PGVDSAYLLGQSLAEIVRSAAACQYDCVRTEAGHAARLLLTGDMIDADEAHRIGLFHEMTTSEQVWAHAHSIAERVAECAPESVQLTKRLINETIGEEVTTQLSSGAAASATARTTEAAVEGLAAFLEKRPPRWK
ncbi:MAG: enoyl-CoA hydratase-related protein, partial [Pirellulaceae bacterium]|nr:enoyl-CoA hydratase-related protein [Pirellulaceae bacterium]